MKKLFIVGVLAAFLVVVAFNLFAQCWAAGLADLAKIKEKVTSEAEVRALLGEPKSADTITKSKGSGRALKERRDLIYNLDGKDVIIRINPETGKVVKVIQL